MCPRSSLEGDYSDLLNTRSVRSARARAPRSSARSQSGTRPSGTTGRGDHAWELASRETHGIHPARDRNFLRELSVMRVVDREQAKIAGRIRVDHAWRTPGCLRSPARAFAKILPRSGGGRRRRSTHSQPKAHNLHRVPCRGPRGAQDDARRRPLSNISSQSTKSTAP